MATASQIEKIEGLNNEALDSLFVKILSKKEFESIQQLEDCIKAKQKTFLNTSAAVFITFQPGQPEIVCLLTLVVHVLGFALVAVSIVTQQLLFPLVDTYIINF